MPGTAFLRFGAAEVKPLWNPDDARTIAINYVASGTYAKGLVLGQVTASGLFKAYATGNSDGSQVARCINHYDVKTDANGLVTLGDQTVNEWGVPGNFSGDAYYCGVFACAELTGLDAGAITALGRLVLGDSSTGVLMVYGC